MLPPMSKSDLFLTVIKNGSLPRKTFSMGEAFEKRYYIRVQKNRREIKNDSAEASALKILYISTLCSKETYSRLFGYTAVSPGLAAQKYHSVMTSGIEENEGASVVCVTVPPVSRANYPGIFASPENDMQGKTEFIYIKLLNIPIIKNISAYFGTKRACLKLLKRFEKSGEESGIICDLLCASACSGALSAQKKFNKKRRKKIVRSVGIVTDLPEYQGVGGKSKIRELFQRLFDKNIKACSGYVFLTEHMNRLLNIDHKPYVIIEGQADVNTPAPQPAISSEKNAVRICMYAGSLSRKYGIINLAEAFISAADTINSGQYSQASGIELHIYGSGECAEELKALSAQNGCIKYLGVISNDEIIKKEQEAILLINPRPRGGDYTKYSFPSKNIEYMASGTALLTTALPGMPDRIQKTRLHHRRREQERNSKGS